MSWLRESSTYQAILEEGREEGRDEGRLEGERRLLIRMARAKLGRPDAGAMAALESTTDPEQIERLGLGLLTAETWDDLLTSGTGR